MGSVSTLLLFLSAIAIADLTAGYQTAERRTAQTKCDIQKISTVKPCCSFKHEAGTLEIWDEKENQFQCSGVVPMRAIINAESMVLPMYTPSPLLLYIQKGRALMGISYPGCPETFISMGEAEKERGMDQHQKIHRIQEGDAVAIPSGAVHWIYNDADEDLVAFSIADFSSQWNQLDRTSRAFYLAGGQPKSTGSGKCEKEEQIKRMTSILQALDVNMLADSFGIPVDLAKKMQRQDDRGFIVKVSRESMRMIRPTEKKEWRRERSSDSNGLEEIYCNTKIHHYLDNPMEADVFSKHTGRLNSANMFKLPILRYLGLSVEKGDLKSGVLFGPHWSVNAHTIVYVTRGGGRTQIVSNEGKTIFDENVKSGDVFVIPQYFASMHRAGGEGAEWVAFKTSPAAMRSPITGHASVFKGMPTSVIASAYRISESQAGELKCSREDQMMMFSPRRTSPRLY